VKIYCPVSCGTYGGRPVAGGRSIRDFRTDQREMSGGRRFAGIILRGAHPKTLVLQRDRDDVQTVESSFVDILVPVAVGFQVVMVPPNLSNNSVYGHKNVVRTQMRGVV